jgi:SpoVK/Ycf46/Vps4 family AAA+-type ATPase
MSIKGGGSTLEGALLTELDGLKERGRVFVLAATNRPWNITPALLRAGRLNPWVYVPLPDQGTRAEIVRILAEKLLGTADIAGKVDCDEVAKLTEGYSGADLHSVLVRVLGQEEGLREAIAKSQPSVDEALSTQLAEWKARRG